MNQPLFPSPAGAAGVRGGNTFAFAVFGNPVAQSLGPLMHRAAYAHLGVPATYEAFRVDEATEIVETIRRLGLGGASVTIPFKETVMPLLDGIDPAATAIGAVNTVCREGDRLVGYNTDWSGLIKDLEAWTTLPGKRFVVLGAGGAARAAVFGLIQARAIPMVINRTESRAREISQRSVALGPLGKIARWPRTADQHEPIGMVPIRNIAPARGRHRPFRLGG